MREVVSKDQATEEINGWLEWRKQTPTQIEAHADSIATLIEGIQYGMLSLSDNCFKQKLLFPAGKDGCLTELQYESRVNSKMLEPYMKGVKPNDGDARLLSYLECMTAKTPLAAREILKTLDPADTRFSNSIVVFFLG